MIEADSQKSQNEVDLKASVAPSGPPKAEGQDGYERETGTGLPPRPEMKPAWKVRTPLWRRFTALFTLCFVSVVAGFILAAALGITALLVLFVLERAIAT